MMKLGIQVALVGVWMSAAHVEASAAPGYVIYWGIGGDPIKNVGEKSVGVLCPDGVQLSNAVAVAVGDTHGLVLRNDGTVLGWGGNRWGQATGNPSPWPGRGIGPVQVNGAVLSNVVAIAAGGARSLALKNNGSVVAWGIEGPSAKPLPLAAGLSNIVAIASGQTLSVGVNQSGEVLDFWSGRKIEGLSNIIAVAVQKQMTAPLGVALQSNGAVMIFNGERLLECEGKPPVISNVVSIACGQRFSLALTRDGSVHAWGYDTSYDAANGSSRGCWATNPASLSGGVIAVSAGEYAGGYFGLGLKRDGSVASWEMHKLGYETPAGLTNVVAIAAGERFSLAITTNAAVAEQFRK